MIRMFSLAAVLALTAVEGVALTGLQSGPAPKPHPEEAAILDVIDKFMDGITNNDNAVMAEIRAKDGFTITSRTGPDGNLVVNRRPYNPDAISRGNNRERYWDPVVHVRGGIAVVWTPYEFWSNGKTSHCGIDTFDLFKEQGVWKISHAMWTVEPDACPALRPADPSKMRPAR